MGQFRDPRAEREVMEWRLQNVLGVIPQYLDRVEENERAGVRNMIVFRELARCHVKSLLLSYSLGADPRELVGFVGPAVDWWIEYQREYHREKVAEGKPPLLWSEVPILTLDAARLLSVVVLLGTEEQRVRMGEVIGLRGVDTVLEFLAGVHGDSLQGVEVVVTQERPYGRLVKVVQGSAEQRPGLMADFVKHWYNGCRKAPWWGDHLRGPSNGMPVSYDGYWCFEAAAVTKLLGIDDGVYRDNEYYPKDIFLES